MKKCLWMEIVNLSSNDDWKLMPFNISFSLLLTKQIVFSRGTPWNSEKLAEQQHRMSWHWIWSNPSFHVVAIGYYITSTNHSCLFFEIASFVVWRRATKCILLNNGLRMGSAHKICISKHMVNNMLCYLFQGY